MDVDLQRQIRELSHRQAIHDCLVRYCRGVDRLDRELLVSAYHPDAVDDHGMFVGGPEAFADFFISFHGGNQHLTQHIITNHHCELEGDVAHCETYWLYAAMNREGPPLSLAGGRYVDRMERRDGRWAIAARKCLMDWHGRPDEVQLTPEQLAMMAGAGTPARDRGDASYERPLRVDPGRIAHPPQSVAE